MDLSSYKKIRKAVLSILISLLFISIALKVFIYKNDGISLSYFLDRLHFYIFLFWFFSLQIFFFSWWRAEKEERSNNKDHERLNFWIDSKKYSQFYPVLQR